MRLSIPVKIGTVQIGGDNPIAIQSMCNTDTEDVEATVMQIDELVKSGCHIVRVAVPNMIAAKAIGKIKQYVKIPVVACIQFDYRLAVEAIEQGVDKIRITPGNIGSYDKVNRVVHAAKMANIPIRLGINSGSLPDKLVKKYGYERVYDAMIENAMEYVRHLESQKFNNIVVSLKSSNVVQTIKAYKKIAKLINYPLHLGVTEAGSTLVGSIKSAISIGTLLQDGIGDTLRVSLTSDPSDEVRVAVEILKALGLSNRGAKIISCPTCARTQIDIIKITREIEKFTLGFEKPITISLIGCAVNGLGEAKNSDIGIIGANEKAVLYRNGQKLLVATEKDLLDVVKKEIVVFMNEKIENWRLHDGSISVYRNN